MKHKRLLSLLLTLTLVLSLLPMSVLAEEEPVAKIGETEYATLDEAVTAAPAMEETVIVLLKDGEITKNPCPNEASRKSIIFEGNGKISVKGAAWDKFYGELTLRGEGVTFEWLGQNATSWLMIDLAWGSKFNVADGAAAHFEFDSVASPVICAFYMDEMKSDKLDSNGEPYPGSEINVSNGSTLEIIGHNTTGKTGQAIQLNKLDGGGSFINVTEGSTLLIDGTNRGYVNSPTIYVENSTFTVRNCTSNGSNGGKFTAINSTINFLGNAVLGLSSSGVTSENSIFNLNYNGFSGLYLSGKSTFDSNSKVYIIGNCENSFAGYGAFFVGGETIFKSGSVLFVTDNYAGGIRVTTGWAGTWAPTVNSSLTVEEGADLTVTGNNAYRESESAWSEAYGGNAYGGGIWTNTTVSVPSDAKIYNNHAATAGDDIYLSVKKAEKVNGNPVSLDATPSITFGEVGSDWYLDGDIDQLDCNGERHKIDGWYDDSENVIEELPAEGNDDQIAELSLAEDPEAPAVMITYNRWNAHDDEKEHIMEFNGFEDGIATVTGALALKAAHGYINDSPYIPTMPPALNKADHVAYIIGYPEDYETGEPSTDKTRWPVKPEGNITRAEVTTIFFRLLTDESRAEVWCQTNDYSDVNSSDWFNNAVSTMTNAGIVTGYPDGTFRPNAPITRAEFAAIAARFSEVVYNGGNSFTDVPENHWAANLISLAEHLGWINGYPDNTFKPDQAITRAEAMTLVNRVLERAAEAGHMDDGMIVWADNPADAWYYEAVQEATNSHEYTRTNEQVSGQSFNYENWTATLKVPDWAALEREWSTANSEN